MVQFLSIIFFLGLLQFLLGFLKVPDFLCQSVLTNMTHKNTHHNWLMQSACARFDVIAVHFAYISVSLLRYCI